MSNKITAAITTVGAFLPEDKLTNADLEKLVETNDEWIRSRTGIAERRILRGEGKGTSDMAAPVITDICRKRNIDPKELEVVIVATVTPDSNSQPGLL
jgi:3-oxoacyl-[acyl-carrier-protein] synthase III